MLHSNSNTTYTTTESPESSTRVRRLRLTLRPEGSSASAPHEPKRNGTTETGECRIAGNERRHNVYFSSEQNSAERAEQPTLHLSNGLAASPRGKVYGLVKRTDPNNSEVLVYEWSVNQLKEEMKYIKEVRTSLETVRQKIFSDSNEMNHRIKYLTKEMKVSKAHKQALEGELRNQSAVLDQYTQVNSTLATKTLDLQKSLLSATLEGNKSREEIENLRASYRQSLDQIKEKDQYLQEAQAENQILQLKVESSQEANASVMRDMTRKLYDQYEAKMKEVEQKHQAEKETIQARINQTLQKLEDVTKRAEEAEMMLKERDQKIEEMDQFIVRMEKERHFLRQRLQEQEQQLHDQQLQQRDELDSKLSERSQRLEEETASLRERIRHLDNMVHCQQKKVKHMIEESQSLKKQIREKDVLIDELMDRISLLEAENNELQDNLAYLKSLSQQQAEKIREQAVSYDFPTSQTSETRRIKITSPYLKLMELSMHRPSRRRLRAALTRETMSSERQGFLGDLHRKDKAELLELLRRQNKLLENKSLIQTLPDKGKRIIESAEKLESLIARHEELERKRELLSAVKVEFQKRSEERSSDREDVLSNKNVIFEFQNNAASIPTKGKDIGKQCEVSDEPIEDQPVLSMIYCDEGESSQCSFQDRELSSETKEEQANCSGISVPKSTSKAENSIHPVVDNQHAGTKQDQTYETLQNSKADDPEVILTSKSDDLLSDKLGRVTLSDTELESFDSKIHKEPAVSGDSMLEDNPFKTLHNQSKINPHYINVLEERAKNPVAKRSPFKPNRLSESPGSSPSQSPGRPESNLSPSERRLRDQKHLDYITAARLPPLHYSSAQLLSLEESRELQISQQKIYEALQAKLAAEKLAEKVGVKAVSFNLEGKSAVTFREYRDQGDSSSSEED
eukprot:gi/632939157/ref/XP_007907946.1/ PREDICTED: myocardial zonula adherens protein-like [Callorhinchus milii]